MGILTIETVPSLNRHCRNALTLVFLFFAGPARKNSPPPARHYSAGFFALMNYLRTFRTFYNFAWTLTDAAIFRPLRAPLTYELKGENFLDELAAADRAIGDTPSRRLLELSVLWIDPIEIPTQKSAAKKHPG